MFSSGRTSVATVMILRLSSMLISSFMAACSPSRRPAMANPDLAMFVGKATRISPHLPDRRAGGAQTPHPVSARPNAARKLAGVRPHPIKPDDRGPNPSAAFFEHTALCRSKLEADIQCGRAANRTVARDLGRPHRCTSCQLQRAALKSPALPSTRSSSPERPRLPSSPGVPGSRQRSSIPVFQPSPATDPC